MMNPQLMQDVLNAYNAHFTQLWPNERFKWEAVKHFQTHWDIEAADFKSMFWQATDKAQTLLTSVNYFPRGMISAYAQHEPHTVRAMFRALFDESHDVVQRIEHFIAQAEVLKQKYFDPKKQSFQNINSVSTYLWLMFPDKYYIYKHSECVAITNYFDTPFKPIRGDYNRNVAGGFHMYDMLVAQIAQDRELIDMYRATLAAEGFADPQLHTLAIDVGFFIYKYPEKILPPSTSEDVPQPTAPALAPFQFAIEKHLEEFIIRNWAHTPLGQTYDVYSDGVNDGQQYRTDTGAIDILAVSKDGRTLLVIELKKGRTSDDAVGQILRYMHYIQESLAQPGQTVRGAIIAFDDDKKVKRAVAMVPAVTYYQYTLHFDLIERR
jgi:hypothetical protein